MLKSLNIQRFKSVRDLKLEFGLVNLFVGGNGSGKSNILESIGYVAACLGRGLTETDLSARGLRVTPPTLVKSSFKYLELPKFTKLEAEFSDGVSYKTALQSRESEKYLNFHSESCKYGTVEIFGRSGRGQKAVGASHPDRLDKARGMWDQIKSNVDVPPFVADVLAAFSKYAIYSPQTDVLRGKRSSKNDLVPIGVHGEGLAEAVNGLLAHRAKYLAASESEKATSLDKAAIDIIKKSLGLIWLPGWAELVGVQSFKPFLISNDLAEPAAPSVFFRDRFMHGTRNKLSVYDSSEGTLFLLMMAIMLCHPTAPRCFAVDNIDNALNPKITRKLVDQIISVCQTSATSGLEFGARQVFMTSHNPSALDAFDLFDPRQKIFVVHRTENGYTSAYPLQPAQGVDRLEWERLMNGRNLSQMWMDGDIGGALGEGGI